MYKPIIKIERETSGRVTLKINKGNYEDHIWFDDEAQFQGFCYAFKMMMAMIWFTKRMDANIMLVRCGITLAKFLKLKILFS